MGKLPQYKIYIKYFYDKFKMSMQMPTYSEKIYSMNLLFIFRKLHKIEYVRFKQYAYQV